MGSPDSAPGWGIVATHLPEPRDPAVRVTREIPTYFEVILPPHTR